MATALQNSLADKFRKLADGLIATIEDKLRPLTQNPTPKRMSEYQSRVIDGNNLELGRKALLALADSYDRGDVPDILRGLKSKADILPLVRHGTKTIDYYNRCSSGEYVDKSPIAVALQQLVAAAETPEDETAKADRERHQKIERMVNDLRFANIPGFFPTPRAVIDIMLQNADIGQGMSILEPSAGIGSIADVIRDEYPSVDLTCCELRPSLQDILREKGHSLAALSDFLELGGVQYDRIVMNPPFEKAQDVEHVTHAVGLLKPGGRVIAIISAAWTFSQQRKYAEFRKLVDTLPCLKIDLPPASFNSIDAFRRTSVNCHLLVIGG